MEYGMDIMSTRTYIERVFLPLEQRGLERKYVDGFCWGITLFLHGNLLVDASYCRAFESYFIQAQRVRRLIQYSFDDVFSHENILHRRPQKYTSSQNKCDVILCPTTIGPAPELSTISSLSPVETYINDVFTVPASLAGLPAINIPVNLNGHILGLQLLGQVGTDTLLLHLSHTLQSLLHSTQST